MTPRIPCAQKLITNGGAANKAFEYLRAGNVGSARDIAMATSLAHMAVQTALSRMKGFGIVRVVAFARTHTSKGAKAAVWALTEKYQVVEPKLQEVRAGLETEEGERRGIVESAIASRPLLLTVWMPFGGIDASVIDDAIASSSVAGSR